MRTVTQLEKDLFGFPDDVSYADFLGLPDDMREEIVKRNRVLQTDTYNRTMSHAKGEEWSVPETYVLQCRRAPHGFLITDGVRKCLNSLFRLPITANEVQFATDFYRTKAKVPYFNERMWNMVLDDHGGVMPLTINALPDGTAILPGDPILRVEGPGELAAHFEPVYHRIFYPTLVGADAYMIDKSVGPGRFAEFGKRGAITEEQHMTALRSMFQASGIRLTSNDAMVAAYPDIFTDSGTIGHRFLQFYDTEEEAMRHAIEQTDKCLLLVDLSGDSIRGIDLVCKLKQEYRHTGKVIWPRLDSGMLKDQAAYALRRFKELGFNDPQLDKILAEDLSEIKDMTDIDEHVRDEGFEPEGSILYGAGSMLISRNKSRSDASSGYKLSAVYRHGTMKAKIKFGEGGKNSLPGRPTVFQLPDQGRMIGQDGEFALDHDLMTLGFSPNTGLVIPSLIGDNRKQVLRTMPQIESLIGAKTQLSPITRQFVNELRAHYSVTTT